MQLLAKDTQKQPIPKSIQEKHSRFFFLFSSLLGHTLPLTPCQLASSWVPSPKNESMYHLLSLFQFQTLGVYKI